MADEGKKTLKFRQSRGQWFPALTDDTPNKLHVHNLTMVIYILYKLHELPSIGYLVMDEDEKTDGRRNRTNEQRQTNILTPSGG